MTTDDYILKHIGHASKADEELFEKWCGPMIREFGPRNGIGRNGKPMPQGAGAHCIGWWRDVLNTVQFGIGGWEKCHALEIGFCIGLSTRIMLELEIDVTSVDPSDHEECIESAKQLDKQFGGRFAFYGGKSGDVIFHGEEFNLAFIDGDHAYSSIITDIGVCRRLGIKTMVFDDWHPHFGPDTQRAVIDSNLRIRAVIGNYALCEDDL